MSQKAFFSQQSLHISNRQRKAAVIHPQRSRICSGEVTAPRKGLKNIIKETETCQDRAKSSVSPAEHSELEL